MYGNRLLLDMTNYDKMLQEEQSCYKVVASLKCTRREVVRMEMFSFQDMILFATFLITLLAYIDRNNKRK